MEFRTIVTLPSVGPNITADTRALVLGSCFAEHVGDRLRTALGPEQCCVNPFGVLYNPMSIAQALRMLLDESAQQHLDDYIFLGRDGIYHSWLHSTHYSAHTHDACRQQCAEAMAEARRALLSADLLIVTFGTSHSYLLNDETTNEPTDFVVANCHKELATRFTERDFTVDEIISTWHALLSDLQRLRPNLQMIFTVSPYRYRKYGFHASQLAKARLLLATDALTSSSPEDSQSVSSTYFPAYEILLDELRDYRFYRPDMLHPSEQAVDYIWERFRAWTFSPEMQQLYIQRIKHQKALNHYANH